MKILEVSIDNKVYQFEADSLDASVEGFGVKNLSIKEDGIPYVPTGHKWIGTPITVYDALTCAIDSIIRKDSRFEVRSICLDLHRYISLFEKCIDVNGYLLPQNIVKSADGEMYELLLVTKDYIWYSLTADEGMIMLDALDRKIISDNYFAIDGFYQELEEISVGKSKALYKTPNVDYILAEMEGN